MTLVCPVFEYHPDPVATGSVIPSDGPCDCCGQDRGLRYIGPVYAVDEPERLCPWCIADGSAAERYHCTFTDVTTVPHDVPLQVVHHVLRRTPGFSGWTPEQWLFCCGDAAEFIGPVGWTVLSRRPRLREALSADGWPEELMERMDPDGRITAYLFRCRACGAELVYADAV